MLVLLRACRADWVSFNLEGDRRLAMRVLLESTAMRRDCRARRAVVRQARILREVPWYHRVTHVLRASTAIHLGLRSRRVFAARALFLVVVPTLRTALPV